MSERSQFVSSIRVLFDILDVNRAGYVLLEDIRAYWDDAETTLPHNIVPCLHKVSGPGGVLRFDDFVAGLQLAMGTNESPRTTGTLSDSGYHSRPPRSPDSQPRPQPDPSLGSSYVTSRVSPRHNNYSNSDWRTLLHKQNGGQDGVRRGQRSRRGSNEPRRTSPDTREQPRRTGSDDNLDPRTRTDDNLVPRTRTDDNLVQRHRTGREGTRMSEELKSRTPPAGSGGNYQRVREGRRHTLQSGVDFNMVRTMKDLEGERDVYLQTLELVEQAKCWLEPRLARVRDRQKHVTAGRAVEACPGEGAWLVPRLTALCQQIQQLLDPDTSVATPDSSLQHQNKQLSQALLDAQARIARLEEEKILLVKEIFEERSKRQPFTEDSLM